MTRREVLLDDESNKVLADIASDHAGDASAALSELLQAREGIESFLDDFEVIHEENLREQVQRSDSDFLEGRFKTWEEIEHRIRL
jgi:hypothetical protein